MYTRATADKNRRVFVDETTDGENGERPKTGNGNEETCRKKLQQGDQTHFLPVKHRSCNEVGNHHPQLLKYKTVVYFDQ